VPDSSFTEAIKHYIVTTWSNKNLSESDRRMRAQAAHQALSEYHKTMQALAEKWRAEGKEEFAQVIDKA
jgi:predicted N-formylglutamate amidohydrolase